MHRNTTIARRDATLSLPQDTTAKGTVEGAPDYRELLLQDGTSIFIPTSDDNTPTD